MKLTPYATLLTMTKDAIKAGLAPIRARSAKKQAELEACKLDEKCATLETEITELCSKDKLCFDSIINKMDELALAERRKGQFDKILSELFPDA